MNTSHSLSRTGQPARRNAGTGTSQPIRLATGECWSPQASQPVTLLCTEGTFWWTQAGDAHDHLLCAGELLTVSPRGGIVLQALTPAALRIEPLEAYRRS